MAKTIEVKDDPLTARLPEWVDTNREYTLYWNIQLERWVTTAEVPF